MIPRVLHAELIALLSEYPIVTVIGPRQAGKTTLVRHALPGYDYLSLENPDIRHIAETDPKALLQRYPGRVIFDEVQRVPRLLSYLQSLEDACNEPGQFVLTGSHQLQLREQITQSLAGRTALLNLLPLSIAELQQANIGFDRFEDYVFKGFLPRVYDQNQRPSIAYANYYRTYVERDIRQLIQLRDASLFEKFIKLLAGRVGQVMNRESLAGDVGVDSKTISHWLSILEASFVLFKLAPYFENFGKRVIKSPKYYFVDVGLLAYLLGIETPEQVSRDPLVGALFENLVVLEAVKAQYNQNKAANLYFFRDSQGHEIDLVSLRGRSLVGLEIKSSSTWNADFKKQLTRFRDKLAPLAGAYVVYSGDAMRFSDGIEAVHFRDVSRIASATLEERH